jgi:Chitobiase/beta-hexosaminidase C-terminal domain/FG-GAP-like repeat
VTGADLTKTINAFVKFAGYDKNLCNNPSEGCPDSPYDSWLQRMYLVDVESTRNAARDAGVSVSASSSISTAQGAAKAKDGYPLGAPMSPPNEWVTNSQGAGSWIQYGFASPTPLDGVTLFDRPGLANQITAATLAFSDGSSVPVAALPNNGSGLTIRFPARTVTSVRLTITAVSSTTTAAGLAEFEAWRGAADTTAPVVTASPPGGQYAVGQAITLSANEPATIYYTTNGSVPTRSSTAYTGPITLNSGFTLRYIGVDAAGNASAPAQQAYTVPTVDTTAPVVTATPDGGQYSVGQQITLTSNEPGKIFFTIDGSTPTTGSPVYTAPITLTAAFTLCYFAVDAVGNASALASQNYSVPGPPAIITPTSGQTVGRSVTIQLQGAQNSTFRCAVDPASGGQEAPCASGTTLTFTTAGSHTLRVVAVSPDGTVSPPATVTFTVSLAAPAPVVTVPSADGAVLTGSPSFQFSTPGDSNVSYRCRLDAQAFEACASPKGYTGVSAGAHTFTVEATNALGNTGTASRSFTVVLPDTTPPVVSATPLGGTYPAGLQISLSANEAARIHYTVDGSTPTVSSPVYSAPLTLTASFDLRYLAVDTAGNPSAPGSQRYKVRAALTGPSHDFDGDGNADVLARDQGGNLWLHPGNGAGGLLPARLVGTGWNVMTAIFTPGDFDGDGNADVLARDGGGRLLLYPGNGSGGLLTARQVGSGWNIMRTIIGPGDFNGDGNVDVLAVDSGYRMLLYPGNGAGGWRTPVQVGSGWGTMTAVIGPGDFNGDGAVDVLARASGGAFYLYPGDGAGGWRTPVRVGSGWSAMTAIIGPGDFNGDGTADVLARNAAGVLSIYPGDGMGGLKPGSAIGSGWNAYSLIF